MASFSSDVNPSILAIVAKYSSAALISGAYPSLSNSLSSSIAPESNCLSKVAKSAPVPPTSKAFIICVFTASGIASAPKSLRKSSVVTFPSLIPSLIFSATASGRLANKLSKASTLGCLSKNAPEKTPSISENASCTDLPPCVNASNAS